MSTSHSELDVPVLLIGHLGRRVARARSPQNGFGHHDRITKMIKLSGQPSAADTQMRDDLNP